MNRLTYSFFHRPCLEVARDLVGKVLVHQTDTGVLRLRISETEAYCGEEDTACHAHKGRTKRTQILYEDAGTVYIYLCYGIHWLLNIVTGDKDDPQAVLIRACVDAPGPGRLTKAMGITGELKGSSVCEGNTLWIEDDGLQCDILSDKRVGIGYAAKKDQDRLWRFIMKD